MSNDKQSVSAENIPCAGVWVKASERLSNHLESKCCRKDGHWFEANYDKSIDMYVQYLNGTQSNRIPKEKIEWLDEGQMTCI